MESPQTVRFVLNPVQGPQYVPAPKSYGLAVALLAHAGKNPLVFGYVEEVKEVEEIEGTREIKQLSTMQKIGAGMAGTAGTLSYLLPLGALAYFTVDAATLAAIAKAASTGLSKVIRLVA
ncbi:MAG: hypothetical protein AB7F31_03455 [Parachlamydiales bacterium]